MAKRLDSAVSQKAYQQTVLRSSANLATSSYVFQNDQLDHGLQKNLTSAQSLAHLRVWRQPNQIGQLVKSSKGFRPVNPKELRTSEREGGMSSTRLNVKNGDQTTSPPKSQRKNFKEVAKSASQILPPVEVGEYKMWLTETKNMDFLKEEKQNFDEKKWKRL